MQEEIAEEFFRIQEFAEEMKKDRIRAVFA
jgi:hypothetical protein